MSTDNAGDGLREALGAHQRQIDAGGSCICGEWPRPARDVDWLGHLIDQIAPFLAEHPAKPAVRCDTCADTGRMPWMIEGDPNGYQEPDDDGMLPCIDCTRPAEPDAGDVALTLAEQVCPCDGKHHSPGESMECGWALMLARAVLRSPWLAAREREAVERAGERIAKAIEAGVLASHPNQGYKDGFRQAAYIARAEVRP